jgi:uncharacterized membrane protein YfcA
VTLGFVAMALACLAGGAVQGTIGFGLALIVVPVVELAQPGAVPVAVLCASLPMTATMALRERAHVDGRGLAWIMAGRLCGTAAGVWILTAVPAAGLGVAVGTMILLAVVASVVGVPIGPRPPVSFSAGVVSGVMGTTAAIGGPAVAIVYSGRPGPEMRSTIAFAFALGFFLSFGALFVAGQVERPDVVLGIALIPFILIGVSVGTRIAGRIDARWLRRTVLTFAALGGVAVILRALV